MSGSSISKQAALALVLWVPLFDSEDFDFFTNSPLDASGSVIGKKSTLTLVPWVPLFESEDFDLSTMLSLDNCARRCGLGFELVDRTFLWV